MATDADQTPDQEQELPGRTAGSFLLVLWQRKWLIALGLVAGLVVGGLVAARTKPVYRSSAQVLVIKKRSDVVPIAGGDPSQPYLEDFMSTHMALVKSPVIVEKAVKKGNLAELQTFAGQGNPAAVVASSLTVSRDATSSSRTILDLSYQGPVADETGQVLGAVIDGYRDFVGGAYRNVSQETEGLFKKARDMLRQELEVKEREYRDFREKGPLLWKGKDGVNIHQARVGEIEAKRSALVIQKADLEGKLKAAEEALKTGKTDLVLPPTPAPADGTSRSASATVGDADTRLAALLLEEQELLEDFGPAHPQVRSVRAKIAFERQLLGRGGLTPRGLGDDKDPNALARYAAGLKRELAQIEVSQQSLDALLTKENAEAKDLNRYEITDEGYRTDLGRLQQLYDQTIRRLQEINLVRDFGGYDAEVISPPGPGEKVAPNVLRILLLAGALGLALGVGLAFLADVSDKSFRTAEEIRRRLGLPILGHIPFNAALQGRRPVPGDGGAPGVAPAVCVYHRPSSTDAEAYRGLRTALAFATQERGLKVLQITSPSQSDGKTTLAANLGAIIAQSGKRVVLVDADFRRPRLDRLFGLKADQGVTSVLAGEADPTALLQQTGLPGLVLLPCGPRPPNPAELLTSPRFEHLLGELKDAFDYVLVDTPPLLAVTDPCVVAGLVDGVVLAIRVSKNGRPAAERAKDMLAGLGARVLGVIVNGIGRDAARNGYGYRYYAYYDDNQDYQDGQHAEANGTSRVPR